MKTREDMKRILDILADCYPQARTALVYSNAFELLIATILSAQSTDKQVNKITSELFKKYKKPEDFAALEPQTLEEEIKSCGLYRTKALNIINMSRILVERYGSQVPGDPDELQKLPGVGRKTANVVVSNVFGRPAIAVDTHVFRVTHRLGLAKSSTPLGTEKELMACIPRTLWSQAHHWFIYHGRNICRARQPKCDECRLRQYCDFYNSKAGL
ncbi:endonuclease III [Mahella sp.]|uniref:endonuclease III n=1 Tax=Mahella sp. TaxID=2798721 RepID=UPI00343D22B5